MVRDGIPFVAFPLALAIAPAAFGYWWVVLLLIAVAAFMAYFFRDPERRAPNEPGIIVAPADGVVTLVEHDSAKPGLLVSIFLSPLDVHINRSPIAGKVTSVAYTKGRFVPATSDKASQVNEQNTLTIHDGNLTVTCKQIAGVLARRIVCWKASGDTVGIGERFGMIKFGSRTDLAVDAPVELLVKKGMRVRGGETPIARLLNS